MQKQKIFLVFLFFPVFSFGDEYATLLGNKYQELFDMVNSTLWVLAFIPLGVGFYGVKEGFKKIKQGKHENIKLSTIGISEMGTVIYYGIVPLISIYLIIGVWTTVFAGTPNFGYGWEKLINDVWIDFFTKK